jgi:signal transduction histidine kinase
VNAICLAHSNVIPAESYTRLPTAAARLRAITALQQKARSLEFEVAERRRVEQRLEDALAAERAAREEAETALRMRDEFLAAASHELRNPLAILLGRSQFALRRLERDGEIEPRLVVEALAAIAGQANRLSLLLNRLLDVSRLEAGKLTLEPRLAELVTLVERAVSDTSVAQQRHTISLTSPPSLQAWVDPLRLEQVLSNLLDNATRYSPPGTAVEVDLSQPTIEFVELSVRDHGPGIPAAKRDRIFERFYQADGSGFLGGLGLGLYVSRQIVELHGGELSVEFPEDGGSRFIVRLPIEPVAPVVTGDPPGRFGSR